MPLNSVITNIGAQVALASFNRTVEDLTVTQKRISTGYRVADATDDGAAFAVAERIRGEVAANTSANEQLGGAKGLLDVTSASLQNVSNALQELQAVTVKLADGTITAEQRTQYQAKAGELTKNVQSFINDANYNGNNVLKDPTTLANKVVRNGAGDTYTFSGYKALTNIFNTVSAANTWTRGDASSALTKTGAVGKAITNTLTQLNNFGSYSNFVDAQVNYNKAKIDAQQTGIGALIDADLAKESAKLQSLQIRQQLGTQALSIANQAPQTLLSLFR
ncbi:flagellin [Paeniroseomonas aquatica]|uniref:Flagellin n=1 Tax=Paeniroseomonas aquatica TaxID=373043 RepID=A0ABT8ABH7_9PROT|nr:flagellin [Paeniroseomonas aquatica]MDN3566684.1 flagellin [Paeniroseomonas aquatica]